jgi:NADPH:quinone reductase-like Zn-dependent oxidoreductase
MTGGDGVDVVLNSLAGDALTASFELLRADGRFIELGKRDFVPGRSLPLATFGRGLSFAAMDISQLALTRNEEIGALIGELAEAFHSGAFTALPIVAFTAANVGSAFRAMMEGTHIGKLVVEMDADGVMLEP